MKPQSPAASSPRSPRAGGARANCSMKRTRKAGRSPRAASLPSLAIRGPRLRQICLGGMPAWVPSLLGGLRIHHGRSYGRGAGGPPLELRRGRGGRNRDAAAGGVRGGRGDEDAPGRGGGRGDVDAPGQGGGDSAPAGVGLPDDKTGDLVQYGMVEGVHPILLDIDRWIGKIDTEDLPGKDDPALYMPYFSEKGEPDDGKAEGAAVSGMNISLAETFSMMLDAYVEVNRRVADKWKLKANLEKLPWTVVRQEVNKIDVKLKELADHYKCLEKQSVTLMKEMADLSMEPLQPPPLLKHGPDQFDAKKEKKKAMKVQMMEEKKKRKEDYKKLSTSKEKAKKVGKSAKDSKSSTEKDVKKQKDDREGKSRHKTQKDIQKKRKEEKESKHEKKRKK